MAVAVISPSINGQLVLSASVRRAASADALATPEFLMYAALDQVDDIAIFSKQVWHPEMEIHGDNAVSAYVESTGTILVYHPIRQTAAAQRLASEVHMIFMRACMNPAAHPQEISLNDAVQALVSDALSKYLL